MNPPHFYWLEQEEVQMIHPNYSACLAPGPTFKPEVFCTIQSIKDMLTPEEREMIQDLVAEAYLVKTRHAKQNRMAALMKQEEVV